MERSSKPKTHPKAYYSYLAVSSNWMARRKPRDGIPVLAVMSQSHFMDRSHSQIATCSPKKFLFRDVACVWSPRTVCSIHLLYHSLELYFRDSRSLLVVFMAPKKRAELEQRLLSIIRKLSSDTATPSAPSQRNPFFGKVGSRMLQGLKTDELSIATRKWQAREISNVRHLPFSYIPH